MVLLTVVLVVNTLAARWLGFNTADEITIVFCGSKKSLANGIPMANVLFPASVVGGYGIAANDIPSDSIDGLCGTGTTLREANGERTS